MSKISLTTISNLDGNPTSAQAAINANNAILQTAIDNTLSRDGTTPNSMNAQLDMNSNRIINLPVPTTDTEPARLVDVQHGISGTVAIGTVTTLAAGQPATVVNVGTSYAAILNFGIPTGATGANGTVAVSGTPAASSIAVWTNSTTVKGVVITGLVKGNGASDPTAAVSGTDYAPATSGSALLKANGLGGFATPGTGDVLTIGTIELGAASDTTIARASAGVISVEGVNITPNVPVTSKSAAYTVVLADANTTIYHPSSDNNARTFTIDSNANVAYPVGTCLTFVNDINTVTIAITSDTLVLAGSGSTGSRTLAASGWATAYKVASTRWFISGTGLS